MKGKKYMQRERIEEREHTSQVQFKWVMISWH